MKKTLRKLVILAVMGAMAALMLAGCGKKAADTSDVSTYTNWKVAGVEGYTAFKDQVTLRIPIYQRATPNGAANAADNYWTKWVQQEFGDKYNIKVEYVALDRGKENEQYALLAADQKLPVCCFEYDYPDVTLYNSQGFFSEYDIDWFKQVAPTYWKAMTDNKLDNYTKIDGSNVLLIGTRPYGPTTYTFVTFYRQDWIEKVGYTEYPSDPAELLKLYAAMKKAGLGGEHILGGTKVEGNGVDQNYAYRTYPEDKELWATTGDYAIPALSTEAQKKFLSWQNKLYNLGYIDDEYNTRTSDMGIADFVSGKTFTYSCYATQNVDVLNQFYAANPGAKLSIIANNGPETYSDGSSSAYRPGGVFGEYIGFSSQATAAEKTAFAMYLEWMSQPDVLFTLQWGIEGKNFNYENGTPKSVSDQSGLAEQQGHNNNVDMWCLVTAIRVLGDVDKDLRAVTPAGYPDSEVFFQQIKKNYEGQLKCFEQGLCSMDCMFQVSITSADKYKDTLLSKYAELRDMVVMGKEADFEANYAKASEAYLKAGYQAIIDEKREAFKAGKYN